MRVLAPFGWWDFWSPQDVTRAIDRLRVSWLRQDAAGVLEGGTRVVVERPGEAATAPLRSEQASRAVGRLFVDATEGGLEAENRRPGERRDRLRGDEPRVPRPRLGRDGRAAVFAAFRLEEGRWRLAELRMGTAGR